MAFFMTCDDELHSKLISVRLNELTHWCDSGWRDAWGGKRVSLASLSFADAAKADLRVIGTAQEICGGFALEGKVVCVPQHISEGQKYLRAPKDFMMGLNLDQIKEVSNFTFLLDGRTLPSKSERGLFSNGTSVDFRNGKSILTDVPNIEAMARLTGTSFIDSQPRRDRSEPWIFFRFLAAFGKVF